MLRDTPGQRKPGVDLGLVTWSLADLLGPENVDIVLSFWWMTLYWLVVSSPPEKIFYD